MRLAGGPRRGRQGAARVGRSCHAEAAARAGSRGAASSALISRGRDRRSGERRGGGPCIPLPCGSTSSRERLEILDDERRVLSFRVVGGEHCQEIPPRWSYLSISNPIQPSLHHLAATTRILKAWIPPLCHRKMIHGEISFDSYALSFPIAIFCSLFFSYSHF